MQVLMTRKNSNHVQIGERVTLDKVDTFADGVAVKVVGEETFRLCKKMVDEVVLVVSGLFICMCV